MNIIIIIIIMPTFMHNNYQHMRQSVGSDSGTDIAKSLHM